MKSKIHVIGGRVEFNGFRVANLVANLPASIRADFVKYVENVEHDAYSRGRKDGYEEGFKEGQDCVDADYVARLR
jgi:hypothetical protein